MIKLCDFSENSTSATKCVLVDRVELYRAVLKAIYLEMDWLYRGSSLLNVHKRDDE